MELSERKLKILEAIIKNYLETGEPVGSRTISKLADLNLSSATIRNEMSDLEEMGYIIQPHTSAGRIPTDSGYRLYVDNILKERIKELEEREKNLEDRERVLIEKADRVEDLLKGMAKMLAANTNYATMITAPQNPGDKIKFIQLSAVSDTQVLCVIVSDGNVIKNKIIEVDEEIDNETLLKLNVLVNTTLDGLSLAEINLATMSKLSAQAGRESRIIGEVMNAIVETVEDDEDLAVYTSGATNIFKYPELSSTESARGLLAMFENKEELADMLSGEDENESGMKIVIGSESLVSSMKDCSVVTTTYELSDGSKGKIGIIGPKRMDYEKVIRTLKDVTSQLDEHNRNSGKGE